MAALLLLVIKTTFNCRKFYFQNCYLALETGERSRHAEPIIMQNVQKDKSLHYTTQASHDRLPLVPTSSPDLHLKKQKQTRLDQERKQQCQLICQRARGDWTHQSLCAPSTADSMTHCLWQQPPIRNVG